MGHLERVSVELLLQRETVRTVDVRGQGGPEFGSRAAQGSAEGVWEQAGSVLWLPGSQGAGGGACYGAKEWLRDGQCAVED